MAIPLCPTTGPAAFAGGDVGVVEHGEAARAAGFEVDLAVDDVGDVQRHRHPVVEGEQEWVDEAGHALVGEVVRRHLLDRVGRDHQIALDPGVVLSGSSSRSRIVVACVRNADSSGRSPASFSGTTTIMCGALVANRFTNP